MKSSLRRLTMATLLGLIAAALLAVVGWHALSPQRAWLTSVLYTPVEDSPLSENIIPLVSETTRRDTAGNPMLADARLSLERRGHVSALVRQQAHLNDLQIFGQGVYRQQGRGEQRQVKWELQTQVGDVRASLIQLVDDRYLWIDQRLPTERRVDRVDLWRLRRLTGSGEAALGQVAPGQAAAAAPWHSFGGLPMLMESLLRNFDFAAPRQLQLGTEPVYALRGVWKPDRLRELLEVAAEERVVELPPRVPLDVLVLMGSRDYFPYLIEYRAASDASAIGTAPTDEIYKLSPRPLMRIEFYQVSLSAPINPNEFVFTLPDGIYPTDVTVQYMERVQRSREKQLAAAKGSDKR